MPHEWTATQEQAIGTMGRSLLVSAAAGAGKTTVLSERCVHLVCDAAPRCGVDELLVVTFTENAATQMRRRIESALRSRLERKPDPWLRMQVHQVPRAAISTLHGFCARLLRQHFHLLGLDPAFSILDEEEANLLKLEIARDLFYERYGRDHDGSFQGLIDAYGEGNDELLVRQVVRAQEMIRSLADPAQWLKQARERVAVAVRDSLANSGLGADLKAVVDEQLATLSARAQAVVSEISTMGAPLRPYLEHVKELVQIVRHWRKVYADNDYDAMAEVVRETSKPPLPRLGKVEGKEQAQGLINALKEAMFSRSLLQSVVPFGSAEWRQGLELTLPYLKTLLGVVEEFGQRYDQAKSSLRSADFSDLECLALKLLRDPKARPGELLPTPVARMYHKLFRHVLVDEYQDINQVQDAILTLVSRECLCQRKGTRAVQPNFFCVGDVKQSIYRFRLAEPRQFLERMERYGGPGQHGQVVHLQENFRSRGPLLEAINEVFLRLMTSEAAEVQYDQSHWLRAGLAYPQVDGGFIGAPIELHVLPGRARGPGGAGDEEEGAEEAEAEDLEMERADYEAMLIARRIGQMMGQEGRRVTELIDGAAATRPLRYGDIVVLLRAMKFKAERFAQRLQQCGIPVSCVARTGFFEATEVRDMLALLRVLDNLRQDVPLAALLRSPLADMPRGGGGAEEAMAQVRLAYPLPLPFHEAVLRYVKEQSDELAARLRRLLEQVAAWRSLAQKRPLAEVIWTIYQQTGYLAFCRGLENGAQRVANLLQLHQRAQQFGTFRRQGLFRFLRFLDNLAAEADMGQADLASEAQDAVRVMSVHAAKGLEFPVVFLADLGKTHNLRDCAGAILIDREAYVGMSVVDERKGIRYPSLAHLLASNRIRRQLVAEELRLLYVAMTRARECLVMVGTATAAKKDSPPADQWRQQWAGHAGALPPQAVLEARCPLHWLGAVWAAAGEKVLRLHTHTLEEFAGGLGAGAAGRAVDGISENLVALRPLEAPPPPHAEAQVVIHRLTYRYPHIELTRQRSAAAARTAGDMTGNGQPATGNPQLTTHNSPLPTSSLPLPRCVNEETLVLPVDVGIATHHLLQYVDFSRPCTEEDLRGQAAELVRLNHMPEAEVKRVDLEAVQWMVNRTEVGAMLRRHARELLRELPFYLPVPPPDSAAEDTGGTTGGGDDQVMLRGRIDVLVPTERGLVLIDYKTDSVAADDATAHAETHRGQMSVYRQAVEHILRRRIIESHLVFLTARVVVGEAFGV